MAKVRVALPTEIQNQMCMWRHGLEGFPSSYIQFHKELAEKELENLKVQGLEVLSAEMKRSGWGDSMRELNVRAIQKVGKEEKVIYLHWHDSNQEFFIESSSGGSFPFRFREVD